MHSLPQPTSPPSGALTADKAPSRGATIGRILFVFILIAAGLWLGYKAVRVIQTARSLYAVVNSLRSMTGSELAVDQVSAQLDQLSAGLEELDFELRPFYPLLKGLAWAPNYGPTVAATPNLLVAGKALADIAKEGLVIAEPALSAPDNHQRKEVLLARLATATPQLNAMAKQARLAEQALAGVVVEELHPLLAENLAGVQSLLPIVAGGFQLAPGLPRLLGMDRPATYLILVQNNDELRATGGFISAVGTLVVEDASIAALDFVDSYSYQRDDLAYPPAPLPMKQHMDIELLTLRDANWSPDFPTTAQLIQVIYKHDTDQTIDGIVTIDLHAVELLISALGPLQLEGATEPITGANVVDQVKQLWTTPADIEDNADTAGSGEWWVERKDFIPKLANSARQRLESGGLNYVGLVQAATTALDTRAIQLWFADSKIQEQLESLYWDGGIHPAPDADFLAVVDTNMGYNKVDAVLHRSVHYKVEWPNGVNQPALATVTLQYTHPLTVTDQRCEPVPYYEMTYADMTERCYFDFVRVYAPGESKLVSMDGVSPDSLHTQKGEEGTETFAGYFMMQPGETHTVTLQYHLPPTLHPNTYTLVVQRQSGTRPLPLEIVVDGRAETHTLVRGRLTWP
jgi:hypothetical protein